MEETRKEQKVTSKLRLKPGKPARISVLLLEVEAAEVKSDAETK